MKRLELLVLALAVIIGVMGSVSFAADSRYPDWPCVQIKVPELSPGALWAGPSIEDVGDKWKSDSAVSDLIRRVAARRTPLEDAEKLVAGFVTGSPDERQHKAKLLFAGLFDTLNGERSTVMNGIERLARKRTELAEKIRSDVLNLQALQSGPTQDAAKTSDLANEIEWETRIFEDRRKTITYVCEVPVLIEQRLFGLARTIQMSLE
jgi:hypothetical protein